MRTSQEEKEGIDIDFRKFKVFEKLFGTQSGVNGLPESYFHKELGSSCDYLLNAFVAKGVISVSEGVVKNKLLKNVVIGVIQENKKRKGFVVRTFNKKYPFALSTMFAKSEPLIVGDVVICKVDKGSNRMVTPMDLIHRPKIYYQGVVRERAGKKYVYPTIGQSEGVLIDGETSAVDGDRVFYLNRVFSKSKKVHYRAKIDSILGDENSARFFITEEVLSNGFSHSFPLSVVKESRKLPVEIGPKDINGRVDFRGDRVFTIDGESTKDFDDALSVKRISKDLYEVGVHIADVAHYVEVGSAIDKEAFSRSTSVYLEDRTLPMLPPELSNGLCSLVPHEDRLTLSLVMKITRSGNVKDFKLVEGVINSKHRLTYEGVDVMFDEDLSYEEKLDKYGSVYEDLSILRMLSDALEMKRISEGELEFDLKEVYSVLDESEKPVDLRFRFSTTATRIIESMMILSNEVVSEYFYNKKIPFVYRVHKTPTEEKVEHLKDSLSQLGMQVPQLHVDESHLFYQEVIRLGRESDMAEVVQSRILRSLQRAGYSVDAKGHFGLGREFYSHFTSPIRRYSDLIIHRIIKLFLSGKKSRDFKELEKELPSLLSHVNERFSSAMHLERFALKVKRAEFAEFFIGREFRGRVSGVSKNVLFVTLENLIEGGLKVESLGDYVYIEETSILVSPSGGNIRVGDSLNVRVASVDLRLGQVDLELVD